MGITSGAFTIYNARIVTSLEVIDSGWLSVKNGKITAIGHGSKPGGDTSGDLLVDAEGHWLVPGFIDIHIHGGDGADVMDGTTAAVRTIGRFHAKHGTTGWLPTTLTAPMDELERAIRAVHEVRSGMPYGAAVLGLHLEGPFISQARRGAQNPDYIVDPTVEKMEGLAELVPGLIRKITIAPERPGALEVIKWLAAQGIISSIGHTDGTMAEIQHGIQAGASHATHLFNGMRPMHHREGGPIAACLLSDNVVCELIADGYHVEPEVMKLVVKIKGINRISLITDSMSATGKPDGCYKLGGLDVMVENGIAMLTEGHNLAGSTLTMDRAVRNMVSKAGVSLPDAVYMASTTPARELGLSERKGSIEIGKDADLVCLDESLSVSRTWVQGREVFCR